MTAARVRLLGIGIDAVDRTALLASVAKLVQRGEAATVAYANVHVLNTAANDAALRRFLDAADLVYCDGVGVIYGAALTGQTLPERMTGADWMWDFAALAAGKWRVFWLGGEPGVAEAAAARLRDAHPALQMETDHGFHEDAPALIARINAFSPQVLLVGLGTPLQEHWVARWRGELAAPVVWVVGATHDVISGRVSRGPPWLFSRQEWLARLAMEPRRLWRRYLLGNGAFFIRVLGQRFGIGCT